MHPRNRTRAIVWFSEAVWDDQDLEGVEEVGYLRRRSIRLDIAMRIQVREDASLCS